MRKPHVKRRTKVNDSRVTEYLNELQLVKMQMPPRLVINVDETCWRLANGSLRTLAPLGADDVRVLSKCDPKSDVTVIADAEQMKRVINNIVSNSVKYMDKPEKFIHIRVKDVGDFIQVEIEDNGKGIPTKDQPYIFDRFFRSDTSRNSSKGGSGIGLSIVHKIMEDHSGKVWVASREGIGTTMYFVLRKYQEVPINE